MSVDLNVPVDEFGYLLNPADWSPDLAEAMSATDGVTLTAAHWEIIDMIRAYYMEFGITPAARLLTRAIAIRLGKEKGKSEYLYALFPEGVGNQAIRFAGLPRPTGCTKK